MGKPEPMTVEDLEKLPPSHLLIPTEVAAIFRVNPKTVTRWAKAGKIASIRTLGHHRRYRVSAVLEKLREDGEL